MVCSSLPAASAMACVMKCEFCCVAECCDIFARFCVCCCRHDCGSHAASSLGRSTDHVQAFALAELGTSGSLDGSYRLVIKGRFNPKQIESVIKHYICTCAAARRGGEQVGVGVRGSFCFLRRCFSSCPSHPCSSGLRDMPYVQEPRDNVEEGEQAVLRAMQVMWVVAVGGGHQDGIPGAGYQAPQEEGLELLFNSCNNNSHNRILAGNCAHCDPVSTRVYERWGQLIRCNRILLRQADEHPKTTHKTANPAQLLRANTFPNNYAVLMILS